MIIEFESTKRDLRRDGDSVPGNSGIMSYKLSNPLTNSS